MIKKERMSRFVELLNAASRETGITVSGCGCCGSPFLDSAESFSPMDEESQQEQGEYGFSVKKLIKGGFNWDNLSYGEISKREERFEDGTRTLATLDRPFPEPEPIDESKYYQPPRELAPLTPKQVERNKKIKFMKEIGEDEWPA